MGIKSAGKVANYFGLMHELKVASPPANAAHELQGALLHRMSTLLFKS
jgi:hypothetical protein